MSSTDELTRFVRDALMAGHSRAEISTALEAAGWSARERDAALATYATGDFRPPVPRPRPYVSAKDAFLYGLMFVALGISAISLNNLLFALIHIWLPERDVIGRAIEFGNIRWAVASLMFSVPLFVWINIVTNRAIGKDAGKRRSAIRKVLTYLTLFIAALVVLGDLVTLVFYLLSGDTTLRFLLQVLSVGAISGGIFWYYLQDATLDEKTDGY